MKSKILYRSIKNFLLKCEYDQGDKAIIDYDDLYDYIEKTKIETIDAVLQEIKLLTPPWKEINHHSSYNEGKIDLYNDLMEKMKG